MAWWQLNKEIEMRHLKVGDRYKHDRRSSEVEVLGVRAPTMEAMLKHAFLLFANVYTIQFKDGRRLEMHKDGFTRVIRTHKAKESV